MRYFEKNAALDVEKELKIYETGSMLNVLKFNKAAAKKGKDIEAKLGGDVGKRHIDIYDKAKLVKRYQVQPGDSKHAISFKEINL